MSVGKLGRNRSGPRRNTRALPRATRIGRQTPIGFVSIVVDGNTVTVTFDQPVNLMGTPAYRRNTATGALPESVMQTSPTTLALGYVNGPIPITNVVVPFEDGAVRNTSGGFVNAGSRPTTATPPAVMSLESSEATTTTAAAKKAA